MINRALHYAAKKHGEQKYGEGIPYVTHLACVVSILHQYNAPLDVIVAGALHDVLEDTNTEYSELVSEFGPHVATLVLAVTNPKEGTRKQKHAISYPKILEVGEHAVMVKLADRLANWSSGGKKGMYDREYPSFKEALYRKDHWTVGDMWKELDELFSNKS